MILCSDSWTEIYILYNYKAIAYLLFSHQIAIYESTGLLSKIESGASNIQDVVPIYSIIYIYYDHDSHELIK